MPPSETPLADLAANDPTFVDRHVAEMARRWRVTNNPESPHPRHSPLEPTAEHLDGWRQFAELMAVDARERWLRPPKT